MLLNVGDCSTLFLYEMFCLILMKKKKVPSVQQKVKSQCLTRLSITVEEFTLEAQYVLCWKKTEPSVLQLWLRICEVSNRTSLSLSVHFFTLFIKKVAEQYLAFFQFNVKLSKQSKKRLKNWLQMHFVGNPYCSVWQITLTSIHACSQPPFPFVCVC